MYSARGLIWQALHPVLMKSKTPLSFHLDELSRHLFDDLGANWGDMVGMCHLSHDRICIPSPFLYPSSYFPLISFSPLQSVVPAKFRLVTNNLLAQNDIFTLNFLCLLACKLLIWVPGSIKIEWELEYFKRDNSSCV